EVLEDDDATDLRARDERAGARAPGFHHAGDVDLLELVEPRVVARRLHDHLVAAGAGDLLEQTVRRRRLAVARARAERGEEVRNDTDVPAQAVGLARDLR